MGAICWCKDEGKAYETISFMRSDWQAIRSIPYMALCDCSWKSPVLSTVQLANREQTKSSRETSSRSHAHSAYFTRLNITNRAHVSKKTKELAMNIATQSISTPMLSQQSNFKTIFPFFPYPKK